MAAAVNDHGESFEVRSVKALFDSRAVGDFPFDVSPDGQRFLIVSAADDAGATGITVTVNGTAGPKNSAARPNKSCLVPECLPIAAQCLIDSQGAICVATRHFSQCFRPN